MSTHDTNESTSNEADSPPPSSKQSRGASIIKATGRLASRASGLDVLAKDVRRVRPQNPQMWRQLFSAEGAKQIKNKVLGTKVATSQYRLTEKEKKTKRKKNLVGSAATACLAFLAGTYLVAILGADDIHGAARLITIMSGFVFFLMAAIYGFIAIQFGIAITSTPSAPEHETNRKKSKPGAGGKETKSQRGKAKE